MNVNHVKKEVKRFLNDLWKFALGFTGLMVICVVILAAKGQEYDPEAGNVHKFLNSALKPTDIPEHIIELENTKEALLNSENNREYLRQELSSRGEIVDREKKRKDTIIAVLNNNLGGKLKGKGQVIYEASTANKYPAYLQASIIIHETGNGTSQAVRERNNVGGIFEGNKLKYYKSVDDSIWDMASRIKKYYIDEGKTSIEAFGAKYCPIGNNDDGTNKHWIPTVSKYYIKMLNESGNIL